MIAPKTNKASEVITIINVCDINHPFRFNGLLIPTKAIKNENKIIPPATKPPTIKQEICINPQNGANIVLQGLKTRRC